MNATGRYRARLAECDADIAAAQLLRHRCFFGSADAGTRDADAFDERCRHILVEAQKDGELVCTYRLLPMGSGEEIRQTYAAQYYELSALSNFARPMVEMGRFCIRPGAIDPDILRVAWGAMTQFVDETGVAMLFGCSSFHGTDAASYLDTFDMLARHHLAPNEWLPKPKAPKVFRFARRRREGTDRKRAMRMMPPLLRTYLTMGGWVSDHAVVDDHMNTLHVFTGLEIDRVPRARLRALRAAAGS